MRKSVFHPALLLMCLCLFCLVPVQAQTQELLTNPGFEDPFITSGDALPREVAEGWTRWHIPPAAGAPSYVNSEPEYYPTAPDSVHIRSGSNAQRILALYATYTGGLYQTAGSIPTGARVRFSAYAHVWSTQFDEVDLSEEDGDLLVSVGVDPTGGTDGESPSIVWSEPVEVYDSYNEYSVEATAQSETITVFIRASAGQPVKHNTVYIDDASLTILSDTPIVGEDDVTEEATQPVDIATVEVTQPIDIATVEVTEPVDIPTVEVTEAVTEVAAATATPTTDDVGIIVPGDQPTEEVTAEVEVTATSIVEATEEVPQPTVPPIAEETEQPTEVSQVFTSTPIAPATVEMATATPTLIPEEPTLPATPTLFVPSVTPVEPTAPAPTTVPEDVDTGGGDSIREQFPNTITHRVQRGDTVAVLAQRYGSSIQAIREANGLDSTYLIFVGQELIIPVTTLPTATPVPTVTSVAVATSTPISGAPGTPGGTFTYIVQPGDSLYSIARRFNTTLSTIAQLNGIVAIHVLQIGQQLQIPGSATPPPDGQPEPQTVYVVRWGDTLYRIAIQFNVTIRDIAEANGIDNPHLIFPGQRLIIP